MWRVRVIACGRVPRRIRVRWSWRWWRWRSDNLWEGLYQLVEMTESLDYMSKCRSQVVSSRPRGVAPGLSSSRPRGVAPGLSSKTGCQAQSCSRSIHEIVQHRPKIVGDHPLHPCGLLLLGVLLLGVLELCKKRHGSTRSTHARTHMCDCACVLGRIYACMRAGRALWQQQHRTVRHEKNNEVGKRQSQSKAMKPSFFFKS